MSIDFQTLNGATFLTAPALVTPLEKPIPYPAILIELGALAFVSSMSHDTQVLF